MQFAVIKTGGKQYIVSPGEKLKVEKLNAAEDSTVVFEHVLLLADGERVDVGTPTVMDAKVEARVLKQGRAKKLIVFKYRPKARHRTKKGHRQPCTEVVVEKIVAK